MSEFSASVIAHQKNRHLYESFLLPCSSNTFIPNERLRILRNLIADETIDSQLCEDINLHLQEVLLSLRTWKYPSGGSESVLLDPLCSLILNQIMRNAPESEYKSYMSVMKDNFFFKPVMCKNAKSEHRIDYNKNGKKYVLFTSEVCYNISYNLFV